MSYERYTLNKYKVLVVPAKPSQGTALDSAELEDALNEAAAQGYEVSQLQYAHVLSAHNVIETASFIALLRKDPKHQSSIRR